MPKKKAQETQEEQSERFRKAVRDLVDAGELNPTEADKRLDSLVKQATQKQNTPPEKGGVFVGFIRCRWGDPPLLMGSLRLAGEASVGHQSHHMTNVSTKDLVLRSV